MAKFRPRRQERLSKLQRQQMMRFLGAGPATTNFLDKADILLSGFLHDAIDQYEEGLVKEIKKIANASMALSDALSLEELPDGASLSWGRQAAEKLGMFMDEPSMRAIFAARSHEKNGLIGSNGLEYLDGLSKELRALSDFITLMWRESFKLYIPVTRPKDHGLRLFLMSLVVKFHDAYGRLPKLSETSSDYSALEIVCEAHGYYASDKLRLLKAATKDRRNNRRSGGIILR
jgi:hypothetical protein